jgi:hypothetical protein
MEHTKNVTKISQGISTMNKKTEAMAHELIGGIFGWAWLIGIPVWIYFLVQWIRGIHPWWYFAIAIAASAFCKAVAREYRKQSIIALHEAQIIERNIEQ